MCLLISTPCVSQASGVTVNDEVIKVFNEMKVRKSQTPEEVKKRKKAVLFCMSNDTKKIIVEEGKQILQGEIGETVEDPYARFVSLLPLNDCRYGLYDATYETKESKKEDLVFIFWCSIQTISDLLRPCTDLLRLTELRPQIDLLTDISRPQTDLHRPCTDILRPPKTSDISFQTIY